jgi:hypothetical protein
MSSTTRAMDSRSWNAGTIAMLRGEF